MFKYALLINPGHNRVYYRSSQSLSLCELTICSQNMEALVSDIKIEAIADIPYLTFNSERELSEKDLDVISRLSFVFALYKVEEEMLSPVLIPNNKLTDENLSGLLKYTGKTNELFTRMMLNLALSSCDNIDYSTAVVLDPIAGKGTTLFEAAAQGINSCGIEIGEKAAAEAFTYFKKYLETEKLKHNSDIIRQSGENKSFTAKRYKVDFAKSKEDFKNHREVNWEMVAGNSIYADKFFKKNSIDVIVGDLPYGVQHGNITNEKQKQTSLTRSPKDLVKACLPAWRTVLKPGGVIALSWNTFVFPKAQFVKLMDDEGLTVLSQGAYNMLEHRVDNAIKRDIIFAKKK